MAHCGSARCACWKARCASAWLKFQARRKPWSKYCCATFERVVILKLRVPSPAISGCSVPAALGAALAAALAAAGLTSVRAACAIISGGAPARDAFGTQSVPSSIASSGTNTVDCASGSPSLAMIPAASRARTSGLRSGVIHPPPSGKCEAVYAVARSLTDSPAAPPKADYFQGVCPQPVKFAGEQTGSCHREQLHPSDRRGGSRLRQVQGGGDALSARPERLSSFRAGEVDLPQLRPRHRVRR